MGRYNSKAGGMQSERCNNSLFCECGKIAIIKRIYEDKVISMHWTTKSTYWHICKNDKIKRTFKKPENWDA
jgi:hypothetical protein